MTSLLLAAAVTGMISGAEARARGAVEPAGSANAEPLGDKHDCRGKNECKGKGGCKTDKHECKGKNDCKGQGGCSSKMSVAVPRESALLIRSSSHETLACPPKKSGFL